LETEDVEKEVDVAQKVFVPVHAALAESVVSGEVCFLPDAAAFLASGSPSRAVLCSTSLEDTTLHQVTRSQD
jgi:hypothetical protein